MRRLGSAVFFVALLAPFAAPAAAEDTGVERGIEATLVWDLAPSPPALVATLRPLDGNWPEPAEWRLPSGSLVAVQDGAGRNVPSTVTPEGALAFEPGAAASIIVRLATDGLGRRADGLDEASVFVPEVPAAIDVRPPPGRHVLDVGAAPDVRALIGDATRAIPTPPADPGPGLVWVLDVAPGEVRRTVWWNAWLGPLPPGFDAVPEGWQEVGRRDLWGDVGDHAPPWASAHHASRIEVRMVPQSGADGHPVAGIGVESGAAVQAFARVEPGAGAVASDPRAVGADIVAVRALHVAVPTGVAGWSVREGGVFQVHARDAADAAFVAAAGERATPVLVQVLADAGLPGRERIVVVVSPRGDTGWYRWAFVQPEDFVGQRRAAGDGWDEAAILVHEGFHGGQFDAAPWFDVTWFLEGSASETDRYLPDAARCPQASGDCYRQQGLDAAGLRRLKEEGYPFEWRQPDPRLSAEERDWRYDAAREMVANYRDHIGETEWRALWSAIAQDPTCCTAAALFDLLVANGAGLSAEDIARGPDAVAGGGATGAASAADVGWLVSLLAVVAAARSLRAGRRRSR